MKLYEIQTGYMGCSYERCYVWAESQERAVELFNLKFADRELYESKSGDRASFDPKNADRSPEHVELVLDAGDPEFITKLSDEGFGDRLPPGVIAKSGQFKIYYQAAE